ncbi:unnamed protein product [Didymodactylos carnosus]|uniref:Cyclin-dependent kinase 2-associated protein n=1 Tax=Didymodactylos carnosus TaxID=1234261 RepID=A0A8S2N471_9BILA|nr:unnamed protein product [Didymodactylos carnosus]CAF3975425.1 unnamed protein product [Didymodactylos carnosus]
MESFYAKEDMESLLNLQCQLQMLELDINSITLPEQSLAKPSRLPPSRSLTTSTKILFLFKIYSCMDQVETMDLTMDLSMRSQKQPHHSQSQPQTRPILNPMAAGRNSPTVSIGIGQPLAPPLPPPPPPPPKQQSQQQQQYSTPTSTRVLSQSKYAQLLNVIEEMGKDIKPTYAGNKNSAERLRRAIASARVLVRECQLECDRNSRP